MSDITSRHTDEKGQVIDDLYIDNQDNTWSQSVALRADLMIGAKSLRLTLSAGVGSVPIPDTARLVGIKPVSSTEMRVGLEAPEANGTATGVAVAGDLKKGIPVDAAVWSWFVLPAGTGRTFHVKGGTSDQSDVAVM